VQLIDATEWYKPLRKNLGKKNCELSAEDIDRITNTFLDFKESEQSKIFDNEAFGYWKVTVERPLRIRGIDAGSREPACSPSRQWAISLRSAFDRAARTLSDAPPNERPTE
jgi:type I restriction enzyme M protein